MQAQLDGAEALRDDPLDLFHCLRGAQETVGGGINGDVVCHGA